MIDSGSAGARRLGTGVGGGAVESLEMLFVGERYPLKLLTRGQNGGAVIACLGLCTLALSSGEMDEILSCLTGVFAAELPLL